MESQEFGSPRSAKKVYTRKRLSDQRIRRPSGDGVYVNISPPNQGVKVPIVRTSRRRLSFDRGSDNMASQSQRDSQNQRSGPSQQSVDDSGKGQDNPPKRAKSYTRRNSEGNKVDIFGRRLYTSSSSEDEDVVQNVAVVKQIQTRSTPRKNMPSTVPVSPIRQTKNRNVNVVPSPGQGPPDNDEGSENVTTFQSTPHPSAEISPNRQLRNRVVVSSPSRQTAAKSRSTPKKVNPSSQEESPTRILRNRIATRAKTRSPEKAATKATTKTNLPGRVVRNREIPTASAQPPADAPPNSISSAPANETDIIFRTIRTRRRRSNSVESNRSERSTSTVEAQQTPRFSNWVIISVLQPKEFLDEAFAFLTENENSLEVNSKNIILTTLKKTDYVPAPVRENKEPQIFRITKKRLSRTSQLTLFCRKWMAQNSVKVTFKGCIQHCLIKLLNVGEVFLVYPETGVWVTNRSLEISPQQNKKKAAIIHLKELTDTRTSSVFPIPFSTATKTSFVSTEVIVPFQPTSATDEEMLPNSIEILAPGTYGKVVITRPNTGGFEQGPSDLLNLDLFKDSVGDQASSTNAPLTVPLIRSTSPLRISDEENENIAPNRIVQVQQNPGRVVMDGQRPGTSAAAIREMESDQQSYQRRQRRQAPPSQPTPAAPQPTPVSPAAPRPTPTAPQGTRPTELSVPTLPAKTGVGPGRNHVIVVEPEDPPIPPTPPRTPSLINYDDYIQSKYFIPGEQRHRVQKQPASEAYRYKKLKELDNELRAQIFADHQAGRVPDMMLHKHQYVYGIVVELVPARFTFRNSYFVYISDETMDNVLLRICASHDQRLGKKIIVGEIIRVHRATVQTELNRNNGQNEMVISTAPHCNYVTFSYKARENKIISKTIAKTFNFNPEVDNDIIMKLAEVAKQKLPHLVDLEDLQMDDWDGNSTSVGAPPQNIVERDADATDGDGNVENSRPQTRSTRSAQRNVVAPPEPDTPAARGQRPTTGPPAPTTPQTPLRTRSRRNISTPGPDNEPTDRTRQPSNQPTTPLRSGPQRIQTTPNSTTIRLPRRSMTPPNLENEQMDDNNGSINPVDDNSQSPSQIPVRRRPPRRRRHYSPMHYIERKRRRQEEEDEEEL